MRKRIFLCLVVFFGGFGVRADDAWPPVVEYLEPGRWVEGETKFSRSSLGEQARFSLGLLRVLGAFERLSEGLYRHGILSQYLESLPEDARNVWYNANPEPINDRQLGDLIRRFVKDLGSAEATLAQIQDANVKLRLPVGRFALQLERRAEGNPLLQFLPIRPSRDEAFADMVVVFDKADVTWLRGYCHLLMGVGEVLVACDWKEWFDRSGHLFFPKVDGPYPFLEPYRLSGAAWNELQWVNIVADGLAMLAHADAPVAEPERLANAHEHFRTVLALSRQMWKEILAETDDEVEWIPGPNQKSGILGVAVSQEMIDGWLAMIDEMEQILDGKLLVPFWRGDGSRGINIQRVFLESKRVSVVDWLQGVAAAEFLEEGPIATERVWTRLMQVFGDNFLPYAVWFN